jgi:hypothetical protein
MKQVKVTMIDLLSENQAVVERTIDISNISISDGTCRQIGSFDRQKKLLEDWIKERANHQHETLLKLKSWKII